MRYDCCWGWEAKLTDVCHCTGICLFLGHQQANLGNQMEKRLELKKKKWRKLFCLFCSRKISLRIQSPKIQTNVEFSVWAMYHPCHSLMKGENMTLLMCSGTCNLKHPKMNKEASSISRLRFSVSVCHMWYIYRLFVNRKDWFRTPPFNDGITFSWKLEPCHLSLSENRPCTIKWSVTTCH